ncbi:MAG TPA: hypothetical protein V6D37_05965 [Candidatus Sericytochromatia bacterium]
MPRGSRLVLEACVNLNRGRLQAKLFSGLVAEIRWRPLLAQPL